MALHDESATGRGEVDLDRDRILVARSQAGDGSAFAELYTCYHDRLQRFCDRRLHDREEAADVTQEAFTRAWRALPSFAGERRFYPWLTVIAGNLCTDLLRQRARSRPTEELDRLRPRDHEPAAGESTEDSVMAAVDGELVVRALGKLSDRHRRVLTLREGAGLTYQEIATHEGVEITTVETLLWRARQALKREYAALIGKRRPGCGGAGGRDRAQAGRPPCPPFGHAAGEPGRRSGGVLGRRAHLRRRGHRHLLAVRGGNASGVGGHRGRRRPGRTRRGGTGGPGGRHRPRHVGGAGPQDRFDTGRGAWAPGRTWGRRSIGDPSARAERPGDPLAARRRARPARRGAPTPSPSIPRSARRAHSSPGSRRRSPRWPRPRHGR